MEQHVRLKCLDSTIEAVEYGGDRWPIEKGHVVLPAGAADALTRQPGALFTHVLDAPVVRWRVVTPIIPPTAPIPKWQQQAKKR